MERMMNMSLNKYVRVYLTQWSEMKSFTLEFIMKIINYPVQVIILFFIWSFIYSQANQARLASISLSGILTYFIVQKMMAIALASADVSLTVQQDITGESESSLIIYICRPLGYSWYLLSRVLAPATLHLGIGIALLAVVSWSFPNIVLVTWTPVQVVIFLIMVMFSFVIAFHIYLLIGYCTFWLGEAPRWYYYSLEAIVGGTLIPLSFFPQPFYQLLTFLPTAFIYYYPVAVLIGFEQLTLPLMGAFIFWMIFLMLASKLAWNQGLKRFDAQGG